jgi:acyl-CoA reductase-like NAD-dependent aldehyde dehydrogenase
MNAEILISGQVVERVERKYIINPYSKQETSSYPICSRLDAEKALFAAQEGAKIIKETPLSQRIDWLLDVAEHLSSHKDRYAKIITDEVAKPIKFAKAEVGRAIETIKLSALYASNLSGETIPTDIMPSGFKTHSYYKRVPVGVVGAITPFNFPLNLVAHKIAPALVMGNAIVLKPSPEAPMCGYALLDAFLSSTNCIKEAINIVYGDAEVGGEIVSSEIPRVLSFTGSVSVGEIITKNAGIKKLSLELGGNAATYIESSANIENAAKRCALGAFINSGQVCISLQRIYVDEAIYDEFADAFRAETSLLKVGSPYEEDTFLSSLIHDDAQNRALEWIESARSEGAKVLYGGKITDKTLEPTIMGDVTDSMSVVCEEVFAPIVSLMKVKNYDDALPKINNSPYGLQFSMFSNSLELTKRAIDDFDCGGVVINDMPTLRFDAQPYGGVKYSGIGKEGPLFAMEEFTEIKSVVIV